MAAAAAASTVFRIRFSRHPALTLPVEVDSLQKARDYVKAHPLLIKHEPGYIWQWERVYTADVARRADLIPVAYGAYYGGDDLKRHLNAFKRLAPLLPSVFDGDLKIDTLPTAQEVCKKAIAAASGQHEADEVNRILTDHSIGPTVFRIRFSQYPALTLPLEVDSLEKAREYVKANPALIKHESGYMWQWERVYAADITRNADLIPVAYAAEDGGDGLTRHINAFKRLAPLLPSVFTGDLKIDTLDAAQEVRKKVIAAASGQHEAAEVGRILTDHLIGGTGLPTTLPPFDAAAMLKVEWQFALMMYDKQPWWMEATKQKARQLGIALETATPL